MSYDWTWSLLESSLCQIKKKNVICCWLNIMAWSLSNKAKKEMRDTIVYKRVCIMYVVRFVDLWAMRYPHTNGSAIGFGNHD